jgi:hypothetical protein
MFTVYYQNGLSRMMKPKFEHLVNFFGGCFHQDWDLDAQSCEEVLELFFRESPFDEVTNVVNELKELLAINLSDIKLRQILTEDLHCYYMPPEETPVRDWLVFVRDSLVRLMSTKASG